MPLNPSKQIQVCDKCFRACCWYGEFMCEDAQTAGTVLFPVSRLRKLNLEHPDYWTAKKFEEVYGTANPDLSGVPDGRI